MKRVRPMVTCICEHCGKEFQAINYRAKKGLARFCDRACSRQSIVGNPLDRFWNHVDKTSDKNGCWIWTGDFSNTGYGRIGVNGKRILTHRFSWSLVNGEIPDGLQVCHHCDNRWCVNPEHLFLGTNEDNIADMVSKARQQHRLNPSDVRKARDLYKTGNYSQSQLARMFRINQSSMSAVIGRRTWKSID
jgi:hypothetical protein